MRFSHVMLMVTLALLAASCANTRIEQAWMDPQWSGYPAKKVIVIGIGESDLRRRSFEDLFVSLLRERGNDASPSYSVLPPITTENQAAIDEALTKGGYDAILTASPTGVRTESSVAPSTTYYTPTTYYNGFYNYYATTYRMVSTPEYTTQYDVWTVETNMYDAKSGKLLWTGQSSTSQTGNFQKAVKDFSQVIVDELGKRGLIR